MSSRSHIELNSDQKLHSFSRQHMALLLPTLVKARLANLAESATAEGTRTDKSEVAATLIAHAPRQPRALGEALMHYIKHTVADFTPEVDDAAVPQDERPRRLSRFNLKNAGIVVPIPVHERVAELAEAVYDYGLRANQSELIGSLLVAADTDGSTLEGLITAYRGITVGEFDPAAELPLAQL